MCNKTISPPPPVYRPGRLFVRLWQRNRWPMPLSIIHNFSNALTFISIIEITLKTTATKSRIYFWPLTFNISFQIRNMMKEKLPNSDARYAANNLQIIGLRDGPFDIQGGGWDFSSRQVIFSSLLAQQVIFFKSKLQQVFYFSEKITH